MDKVQTYYACLLILEVFVMGLMHGKQKEGAYNAIPGMVGMLVMLPIIGRIFHWW